MLFVAVYADSCVPLQHYTVHRFCLQNGAPFAGGTVPFQPINVPHLSGDGGLLSILSQSRCRFTSPVITLNSWLNWPMVPSYGLSGARSA